MAPASPRPRHLLWHGLAGFGVGLAGTIATAPFASGWSCSDRDIAWGLAFCTPLVAILPALVASHRRLGRGGAAAVTGVLSILAGALNAVLVWCVTQALRGQSFDEIGVVLLFALPFGGIPGAGFAIPMAVATWFARQKLEAPAAALGAGRGLLLVVAIAGAGTSALVVTTRDLVYAAWPVVLVFDAVVALLCLAVAARDLRLALRIHQLASDRTGAVEIADAPADEPPEGLPHVLGGARWRTRPVQILRIADQDPGPYRASRARTPILSLAASPRAALAALVRGALLLVLCAGVLGWSATQTPQLAPAPPLVCGE